MSTQTTTPVRVNEIAFTCYPVKEMARARNFYETILNLSPGSVFEKEGNCWVEYEVGGSTFTLGYIQDLAANYPDWNALNVPAPLRPTIALEVADFDATVKALQENGQKVLMPALETPVCHMAIFEDPEGNSLMIHQLKKGHA